MEPGHLLRLVTRLSLPAILAQLSTIAMQYIDASMVGRLGAGETASIALVTTTIWLLSGICRGTFAGFTVLTAQYIGAGEEKTARNIMKEGLVIAEAVAFAFLLIGAAVSGALPRWLGGEETLCPDASAYLLICALALPVAQLNEAAAGMLQASGNMRTPSLLHILMCLLDVVFNLLLIFPSRVVGGVAIPGAGLGVAGAALGTALAQFCTAGLMLACLLLRSPILHLRRGEKLQMQKSHIRRAIRISVPVCVEETVLCSAQIASTAIVAPLGTISIAAHSFAITAESLCYMPGYGIGEAAATVIGQSIGARREELTQHIGYLLVGLGVAVMTVSGALMYWAAPWMIGILSPDAAVIALGAAMLRIEAFAEPLYAASIVASGVFRGAGDTLKPSLMNFCSMWLVRLPMAAILSHRIGLRGVWIAMCIELCFRGTIFLVRLFSGRWKKLVTFS